MGIKELFDVLEEARVGQNKQTQTKTTKHKPKQPKNPNQPTPNNTPKQVPFHWLKRKAR